MKVLLFDLHVQQSRHDKERFPTFALLGETKVQKTKIYCHLNLSYFLMLTSVRLQGGTSCKTERQ